MRSKPPHLLIRVYVPLPNALQGCSVNETILQDAATFMSSTGLQGTGYTYINTDGQSIVQPLASAAQVEALSYRLDCAVTPDVPPYTPLQTAGCSLNATPTATRYLILPGSRLASRRPLTTYTPWG